MEFTASDQFDRWRAALRHVYWIGGPPDSGKTTATHLLAEKFGLQPYHQDRHERDHPDLISPLLTDPRHAVWLIPTPEFKRASHERRGKSGWCVHISDPERALTNHVERDLHVIEIERRQLERHQLPFIEVDGNVDPAVIATRVARHFRLPQTQSNS